MSYTRSLNVARAERFKVALSLFEERRDLGDAVMTLAVTLGISRRSVKRIATSTKRRTTRVPLRFPYTKSPLR